MAIQGIQYFKYKQLLDKLEIISSRSISIKEQELVNIHTELLKNLYESYHKSIQNVTSLVNLFEQQEIAIRNLSNAQKKNLRSVTTERSRTKSSALENIKK